MLSSRVKYPIDNNNNNTVPIYMYTYLDYIFSSFIARKETEKNEYIIYKYTYLFIL